MGLADALRIGGAQHRAGQLLSPVEAAQSEADRSELAFQLGVARIGWAGVAECVFEQLRGDLRRTVDQTVGVVGQPVQLPAIGHIQGSQDQLGDPFHRSTGGDQYLRGAPMECRTQGHRRGLVQHLLQQPVPEPQPGSCHRLQHAGAERLRHAP